MAPESPFALLCEPTHPPATHSVPPIPTPLNLQVFERVRRMAPESPDDPHPHAPGAHPGHQRLLHAGAAQLVELAQGPQYLCKMDPLWHPWY